MATYLPKILGVSGALAVAVEISGVISDGGGLISVDDAGGSLTVDIPDQITVSGMVSNIWHYPDAPLCSVYNTAQTDTIIKAVSPGARYVITTLSAMVGNTTGAGTNALFEFDNTADVPIVHHPCIPPGGGFILGGGGVPVAIGGDGEDLLFTCGSPSGQISISVLGYVV